MTPQEIDEYKRSWKPGFTVRLHSDLDNLGKAWCRKHLQRHQWSFTSFTDVYEHTFHFELEEDALLFTKEFLEYTNQ
jgi:hypothetical protein